MYKKKLSTLQIMLSGLVLSAISLTPFFGHMFNINTDWANNFVIKCALISIKYMITLFHETSHSLFAWFYGYVSLPSFDVTYDSGGIAFILPTQHMAIVFAVWVGIGYLAFQHRSSKPILIVAGLIFLLNILFTFNQYHHAVIYFMGPASEGIVASFFLYRALFNLTPRGDLERLLNSFYGFAMAISSVIYAFSLLFNESFRLFYYKQKSSLGMGDFDRLADIISFLDFEQSVIVWIVVHFICISIPFILFVRKIYIDDLYSELPAEEITVKAKRVSQ